MAEAQNANAQLTALAAHLSASREMILERWRRAVESDPELTSASVLSWAQFYDHIPAVLDAFERELCARQPTETFEAKEKQKGTAAEHGLQRWHLGYNQTEVMREWGHLHLCLVEQLEDYAAAHRNLEDQVMPQARRALARLCSNGVIESASRYARLQQVDAGGRVLDLQQALAQLRDLERQRAETWREAAHDLRGNVSVVKNLVDVLNRQDAPGPLQGEFLIVLQRSIASLNTLLEDLLMLSRVEAGQEQRKIDMFDAASLLGELCSATKTFADERGLFLEIHGPVSLPVQGDIVKIRRIAQNLLLNALKYTERGGVRVTWGEHETEGLARWTICVQDTGPGLGGDSVAPLAQALERSTEESRAVDKEVSAMEEPAGAAALPSLSTRKPNGQSGGEGIGLSIVKRLCELLDASVEVETEPGKGSTFRIVFPRRYDAP